MAQKKGTRKKYNLTATIYDKRGKILSVGNNSYTKTHPTQYHYASLVGREEAVFLHAEIAALIKLKCTKDAHRIVIERYGSCGQSLPSVPCSICEKAIEEAGIKVVEYNQ